MFCATGTIYTSTAKTRPFFTLGAGVAFVHSVDGPAALAATTYTSTVPAILFAAGVDIWHIRVSADYNLTGKANGLSTSYPSIRAGFFLGGGRKKN